MILLQHRCTPIQMRNIYRQSKPIRFGKRSFRETVRIRHNGLPQRRKKNLYERTKKVKLGSKVSIVGELDIHNNKLCGLHNFEYISNITAYTTTPSKFSFCSQHPLHLEKEHYCPASYWKQRINLRSQKTPKLSTNVKRKFTRPTMTNLNNNILLEGKIIYSQTSLYR